MNLHHNEKVYKFLPIIPWIPIWTCLYKSNIIPSRCTYIAISAFTAYCVYLYITYK